MPAFAMSFGGLYDMPHAAYPTCPFVTRASRKTGQGRIRCVFVARSTPQWSGASRLGGRAMSHDDVMGEWSLSAALLEAAPDGILVVDEGGIIELANRRA